MGVNNNINITVKFSGRSIPITISPDSTVMHLKSLLLPRTHVLVRGQKLIFKGKVTNGPKIMLVGSQGLHHGHGEDPVFKEAESGFISRNTSAVEDKKEVPVCKNSLELWKATEVIALAECNLKTIPDEIWECSPFIRILDMSNNSIQSVPE